MTGQHFDEETVEAMYIDLEAELERKGYGDTCDALRRSRGCRRVLERAVFSVS